MLFGDPRLKDTTLIWAHAGRLGRFIAESGEHIPEIAKPLNANKLDPEDLRTRLQAELA